MCVHLLFGLMLLGSKYLSYVCQPYKKNQALSPFVVSNIQFVTIFNAIRPLF